ncbi:hypothetical protein PtA15_11A331 [Puccinia triticina]|uniref:Uncharacterized protein n=1 Tax=Puccinia triticina TaxID=208348 RepID=A0ABY7CWP4_9BASI|nr:uncharacterized protein PtA15_11A331 [Puccinia triticina]WAQ89641.1 hypothetical protein PtA15_11A331 [Puccinia triticina]
MFATERLTYMAQAASDNMSLPSFDVSRDFAVPTGTMPRNQLPGPPTLLDPILPAEGSIVDPPAPAASFDSELLASFANLTVDPPTHIDCSRFYHISLVYDPPVITLVTLKTALFYVMEMTSLHTSSCMLKLDHNIIELVASGGLQANSSAQALSYADKISQLRTLYDPIPFIPKNKSSHRRQLLASELFQQLVRRLNDLFPLADREWLPSDQWQKQRPSDSHKFAPINSWVELFPSVNREDITFSNLKTNKNNSVIALKPNSKAKYAVIRQIFKHSRKPPGLAATSSNTCTSPQCPKKIPLLFICDSSPNPAFFEYLWTVGSRPPALQGVLPGFTPGEVVEIPSTQSSPLSLDSKFLSGGALFATSTPSDLNTNSWVLSPLVIVSIWPDVDLSFSLSTMKRRYGIQSRATLRQNSDQIGLWWNVCTITLMPPLFRRHEDILTHANFHFTYLLNVSHSSSSYKSSFINSKGDCVAETGSKSTS